MKSYASLVVSAMIALMLVPIASSSLTCPYTHAALPTPYAEVTMYPVEKHVGKAITITVIDVSEAKVKTPANNRIIMLYYMVDNESAGEYTIYTGSDGKATFIPEDAGEYVVTTSARYIRFHVSGICGDDHCSADESRNSCPKDCATCGDGTCDVNEDKTKCPRDCIICGDSVCDPTETRATCPGDCASCGDGTCDINENKLNCPEDCVRCGDGTCDIQEIFGLHGTSCLEDCAICGDGVCDKPVESELNCVEDCVECGDGVCEGMENDTCPQDCAVCGDGTCDKPWENKTSCSNDCVVCGDSVCDMQEVLALHETSCLPDCAVCGDGFCDSGESGTCDKDCAGKVQGVFIGYFLVPIVLVMIIVLFEVTHHFAKGHKKEEEAEDALLKEAEDAYAGKKEVVAGGSAPAASKEAMTKGAEKKPDGTKLSKIEPGKILPYFAIFALGLMVMGILLAMLGLSYEKNLAIFDVGSFLLEGGPIISLMVIALSAGIGILARATYYMDKKQALPLSLGFAILGMAPGMIIFLNVEYMVLMAGIIVGTLVATITVKKEEIELSVKKPFKIAADSADKTLFIASIFVCIMVFLQLYTSEDTNKWLAKAIWESDSTREVMISNVGTQNTEEAVRTEVVDPFFRKVIGGADGKLAFSAGAAVLLLVILKLFIMVIKLLSGFFAWMLDRSELI